MPRASAYGEALADDEVIAEQILSRADDDAARRSPVVRVRDYSPTLEALITIQDLLAENMQAVIAAAGGEPPKVKPRPRPVTAVDRIRERHRLKQHKRIISRIQIQQPDGTVVPLAQA